MRISFNEWMKDPAKWMERAADYHNGLSATQARLRQWAATHEGRERIQAYMLKHGYTLDENGDWIKVHNGHSVGETDRSNSII